METNAGKVYDKLFEEGLEFEDYVYESLWKEGVAFLTYSSYKRQKEHGDGKAIEIKYDKILSVTGNVFIETAFLYNGTEWKPSGIHTGNPMFYVIGDYKTFYVFSVRQLRRYCDFNNTITNKDGCAKGVLLNQNIVDKYAVLIVKSK